MEAGCPTALAVLTSRLRFEEVRILEALERRGVAYRHVDERSLGMELDRAPAPYAGVLNRIMSHARSLYAARMFEARGVPVINAGHVIETCGDKILASLALVRAGVPTPRTFVALGEPAALAAIDELGYPLVLKPAIGSWGRLLARVNDRDAAEALLEHKRALQTPTHSVFYLQEYIEKPGRDIRAIVVGEEVIGAMRRRSDHWITNTAAGAGTEPCALEPGLADLARRAALAMGGGALAVDLVERPDGELLVTEVNHTMEFRGMVAATGIDVADWLVRHALEVAGR